MESSAIPKQSNRPESQIRDERSSTIVQILGPNHKISDLRLIWFDARNNMEIGQLISKPFTGAPAADLGSLDQLPLELLHQMCLELGLRSIFKFRQVNRRSRQVVDSLKEYQNLASNKLSALTVLLRTQLAPKFSLSDFYSFSCTTQCRLCGDFGGYISLPNWIRCCYECVRQIPAVQAEMLSTVQKKLYVSRDEILRCRTIFRRLPSVYNSRETSYKSRDFSSSSDRAFMLVDG